MNHIEEIQDLLAKSADHVNEHGHHQFDMWEGKACCIMGAPRMVSNEASYSHILRDVLAHLGYHEPWNDEPGRTKEEVVTALKVCIPQMTPELMIEVYGPHWSEIFDFISEVDDWDADDYARVAATGGEIEYSPEFSQENRQYLNALVGFLGTVMTSGKSVNSMPFKRHFDTEYEKRWRK